MKRVSKFVGDQLGAWVMAGLTASVVLYRLYPAWLHPARYLVGIVYDNSWIFAFPTRISYNLLHHLPLRAYETIGYPLPLYQREIMPAMRSLLFLLTRLLPAHGAITLITVAALIGGAMAAFCWLRSLRINWPVALLGGIGFLILLSRDINTADLYFPSASLIPLYLYFLSGWLLPSFGLATLTPMIRLIRYLWIVGSIHFLVAGFTLWLWLGLSPLVLLLPLLGFLGLLGLIRLMKRLPEAMSSRVLSGMTALLVFGLIVELRIEMGFLLGVMSGLIVVLWLLFISIEQLFVGKKIIEGSSMVRGGIGLLLSAVISLALPYYLLFLESGAGTAGGLAAPENTRTGSLADLANFSPRLGHFINENHPLPALIIASLLVLFVIRAAYRKDRSGLLLQLWLSGLFLLAVFLSIKPEVVIFGHSVQTIPYYLYHFGFRGFRRYGINEFSVFLFEWAAAGFLLVQLGRSVSQRFAVIFSTLTLGVILWRFYPPPPLIYVRPITPPAVYRWLKDQPPGAILEHPLAPMIDPIGHNYLFWQSYHGRPLVNGIEIPGKDYALGIGLQRLDRYDIPVLSLLGVKYVIVHPKHYSAIANRMTTDAKIWYFESPVPDLEKNPKALEDLGLSFVKAFPESSGLESYVYEVPVSALTGAYATLDKESVDLLAPGAAQVEKMVAMQSLSAPQEIGRAGEVILKLNPPVRNGSRPVAGWLRITPYLWGPSQNSFELYYRRDGKNFELIDRRLNDELTPHPVPQVFGLPDLADPRPIYIRYHLLALPPSGTPIDARLEELKVDWFFERN